MIKLKFQSWNLVERFLDICYTKNFFVCIKLTKFRGKSWDFKVLDYLIYINMENSKKDFLHGLKLK
jgi:hypothetical protein